MVTSAPPATADLLYLSSNCSTARQQPEVNTTPTLQHVCLFYHSCKAVWYKVCLTCSWEMMNNTFTHVERKYSKSSINHLKCPTASWIRHMCQVAVMLLSVHVCFLGWHLVFSTLLFSSRAWFSLLPVLYEMNQPGPVTWALTGLPSLHTSTASPSLALPCFPVFFAVHCSHLCFSASLYLHLTPSLV